MFVYSTPAKYSTKFPLFILYHKQRNSNNKTLLQEELEVYSSSQGLVMKFWLINQQIGVIEQHLERMRTSWKTEKNRVDKVINRCMFD